MSLSAKNTAPEDEDFADIEFRPKPIKNDKPVVEEKQETPAPEEVSTEPTDEKTATVPPTPAVEKSKKAPGEEKRGKWAVFFDVLLVTLLLAVLGFGGYYIKIKMDEYRVPSPMDIALQENARLQRERDAMVDAYYKADEQLLMLKSLEHLDNELSKVQDECAGIEQSIAENKDKILALQHEIRTTDSEYRSVALSLLPGMAIGDAVTNRGKALKDAYIYRLEGNLITLRSHEGQIRIPTRQLIKKDMPRLARYAFGEEDLVDMSDFDANGEAPQKKSAPKKQEAPKEETPRVTVRTDYEPASGAPTVDTSAGTTITAPESAGGNSQDVWVPTEGELPF